MGKRIRVFMNEGDYAKLTNQKNCKRPDQDCFFCDLLDCKQIIEKGIKQKVGTVRLYGKEVTVVFSPQEGCWLPHF